jgi:hypothetical protein
MPLAKKHVMSYICFQKKNGSHKKIGYKKALYRQILQECRITSECMIKPYLEVLT